MATTNLVSKFFPGSISPFIFNSKLAVEPMLHLVTINYNFCIVPYIFPIVFLFPGSYQIIKSCQGTVTANSGLCIGMDPVVENLVFASN